MSPRRDLAAASLALGTLSVPSSLLLMMLSSALDHETSIWVGRALLLLGCVVGPIAGIALGATALIRSPRHPQTEGRGKAAAGLAASTLSALLVVLVVVAGLHAQRMRQESPALGDVRTVIAAEEEYRSRCGAFGRPECLFRPSECIAGYAGPAFLDRELASLSPIGGYARRLYEGPNAPSSAECRSGLKTFAYVAVPQARRWVFTGRGFCGDHRGVITFTADGSEPPVHEGECGGDRIQ